MASNNQHSNKRHWKEKEEDPCGLLVSPVRKTVDLNGCVLQRWVKFVLVKDQIEARLLYTR